jgi:DNA-binding MarR family transcriptional regulator
LVVKQNTLENFSNSLWMKKMKTPLPWEIRLLLRIDTEMSFDSLQRITLLPPGSLASHLAKLVRSGLLQKAEAQQTITKKTYRFCRLTPQGKELRAKLQSNRG